MKHSKIFSTDEVKAIMSGRMTAFYELVPSNYIINIEPDRYKCHGINEQGAMFEDLRPDITPWLTPIHLPYALNEPIYVRETWCKVDKVQFDYKSDDNDGTEWTYEEWCSLPWNSPATMPKSAARLWLEITDVKCMRAREMTLSECGDVAKHLYQSTYFNPEEPSMEPDTCFYENFIDKYGRRAYEFNPFIFLYSFKVTKNKGNDIF